jgi:hypothetical protein
VGTCHDPKGPTVEENPGFKQISKHREILKKYVISHVQCAIVPAKENRAHEPGPHLQQPRGGREEAKLM